MSVKLTVVYDNPTDPAAFEEHYKSVHMSLAGKVKGIKRVELAKVFPKEDGTPTPAYRTADLYFDDYDSACAVVGDARGPGALTRCGHHGDGRGTLSLERYRNGVTHVATGGY